MAEAQLPFNHWTFPASFSFCPYDSSIWGTMELRREDALGVITYGCGTIRVIENDDLTRLNQSVPCMKTQLHNLRDLDEPGLRKELKQAEDQVGLLQSEVDEKDNEIEQLQARIAALLEGGKKAVRFDVAFGTPKDKPASKKAKGQ